MGALLLARGLRRLKGRERVNPPSSIISPVNTENKVVRKVSLLQELKSTEHAIYFGHFRERQVLC